MTFEDITTEQLIAATKNLYQNAAPTSNGNKPALQPSINVVWKNDDESDFNRSASSLNWGKNPLSIDRRYSCLLTCIKSLCKRHRNAKRRILRIRCAVKALELKEVQSKELNQLVLEILDDMRGNAYQALTAEDRKGLVIPEVEWIFKDLVP